MTIARAKVVIVGASGVGKTSLIRRFVSNEFLERHIETIGVRIEKKEVALDAGDVELIIWDIAGGDHETPLRAAFIAGAQAVMYVADRSRTRTVVAVSDLIELYQAELAGVPAVALLNKSDLPAADDAVSLFETLPIEQKWHTSALQDTGVEDAFVCLAESVCSAAAIPPTRQSA